MATSSSRYKQEASPTCHPRIHDATHTETRRTGRIRIRANLGSTSRDTTRRKQRKEHLSMHVVLRWCTGSSLPVREARFKRVPLASFATHDFVACQRERNLPNLHSWKRRRPPPQNHCGRSHASKPKNSVAVRVGLKGCQKLSRIISCDKVACHKIYPKTSVQLKRHLAYARIYQHV